eukprot:CAMPEP_0178402700 /NCGR_PEP_ID=MMETSP0689_2-20121128/16981_1 /TAXON_ID=160604 /ORGANISM="Amphidinium massartii, Strain CS-259" /LENGTH=1003 /DNA_ID=CAMNT_0020023617 /DNA_START=31 /DNA_END=3038 /DNA_ORIENTATION=-
MAPTRVRTSSYDFHAKDLRPEEIPSAILTFTTQKGYCLFKPQIGREVVTSARAEAAAVSTFRQPPSEIAEGLLGSEGSAEVASFSDADGVSLQALDGTLRHFMEEVMQLTADSNMSCDKVSSAMLHSTDIPGDEPPDLTMAECDHWAKELVKSKFMFVFNLGGKGTLELEPFLYKDCAAVEVSMEPGSLVVLRADALSHSFTSPKRSFLLTYSLTKERLDTEIIDPLEDNGIPAVRQLKLWMAEKLKATKSLLFHSADAQVIKPDFPSEWRSLMNRQYHKPNSVAVRSFSCKHPGSWDPAEYAACLMAGCDLVEQIPLARFDWTSMYAQDAPDDQTFFTCSKHGAYMEGVELFDPRMFNISNIEAKFMDPCQKVVLETGYEALINASFTKKQLVKSYIGCYVGCGFSEIILANQADSDQQGSGFGGTSAAGSITANRISFVLGIQGPNVAIDCHAASGLVGAYQAVDSLRFQSERFAPCHHAVVSNVALALALQPLVVASGAGFLSPDGRCLSFDTTANGWCKGEGSASMVLGQWTTTVDGEAKLNKDRPTIGLISSANCRHAGRVSTLSAPSGPQERELLNYIIDQALISPLDIDGFEAQGQGWLMHDAVEASSLREIFRDNEDKGAAVCVGTVKSQSSMMMEACALAQLIKVIYMQGYGVGIQGIHLNQMNPYMVGPAGDVGGLHFLTEPVRFPARASYVGTLGRGLGGTMAAMTTWGSSEDEEVEAAEPKRKHLIEPLAFWPAGGGEVSELDLPEVSYDIVGSWSQFEASEPMEQEDEDGCVFGYTVTLGETGMESFYIRLDGDEERVLYPSAPHNGAPAVGPRRWVRGMWTLGGGDWIIPPRERLAIANDPAAAPDAISTPELAGKKYRIRLRVSRSWRSVDWVPAGVTSQPHGGRYYVVGSYGPTFQEVQTAMEELSPGTLSATIRLWRPQAEFYILRNKDPSQAFMPSISGAAAKEVSIVGPVPEEPDLRWSLSGQKGDIFRIDFRRSKERGAVSWT